MPVTTENSHQVLLIKPTCTEKQVARYVTQQALSTTQGDKTFALLNIQDVIQKVTTWRELLPRVTPFYAVKCNYNPVVLETLAALGVCFDCASMHEVDLILSTGVSPDRIIFAHTAKPRTHLIHAKKQGVDLLTFDGGQELSKIKQLHPNSKLVIRIRCDAKIVVNPLGEKFGCCAETEAPKLLRIAKELNLQVVGVSFHVGSLCGEVLAYQRGIQMAAKLFKLGSSLGFAMRVLDVGGGFPGDVGSTITPFAEEINSALDEYFPVGSNVEVIAEPGRYFVASAFTLACFVHSARKPMSQEFEELSDKIVENATISKQTLANGNPNVEVNCEKNQDTDGNVDLDGNRHEQIEKIMYYMDNGVYGSFAGVLTNRLMINPEPLEDLPGPLQPCSLWGPTCDAADVVAKSVLLPVLPLPSWLLFNSFGAYTSTTSTAFNGFGKPLDYAYATQSTWDFLQQLPKIKERSRLVSVIVPNQLPASLSWQLLRSKVMYRRSTSCNCILPVDCHKYVKSTSRIECRLTEQDLFR